jgi:hypothetical protein
MDAILRAWIDEIRKRGCIPVVMVSAMQPDVFHRFATGNDPPPVAMIKRFCREEACLCFDAVEALAASVDDMELIPRLFNVHVAAEGNRIIAERFASFLDANVLTRERLESYDK